jgi:thiamine pyrophosphate-dependent acetolactate synthase large subunit-like protein
MDVELGEHYNVTFTDPDVVKSAECFGANGYRISSAGDLLPTPRTVLGEEGVSTYSPRIAATRLPRDPAGHGESGAGDPPLRR